MSPTTLKVTRVWETILSGPTVEDAPDPAVVEWMELDPEATPADAAAEFAGRACYQSFGKPNPNTRENSDYLAHILEVGHYSVLSHAVVGYYIEGVSRSLTHELVRHRFPSFSQLSQRYVKLDDDLSYVVPPVMREDDFCLRELGGAAMAALETYRKLVEHLEWKHREDKAVTPKQIRQAARAVLPNMTETKIVVSANLRGWRDLLSQRLDKAADAEIQELANALLADLADYAPGTFQDLVAEHGALT